MNAFKTQSPLLTYDEIAAMLNLPLGTIYAMVSRRKIPHLRIGPRLVRFRLDEIEAWIQQQAVATAIPGVDT